MSRSAKKPKASRSAAAGKFQASGRDKTLDQLDKSVRKALKAAEADGTFRITEGQRTALARPR